MPPSPPIAGLFRHRLRAGIVGVAGYFGVFAPVGYQTELRLEIFRSSSLLRKNANRCLVSDIQRFQYQLITLFDP